MSYFKKAEFACKCGCGSNNISADLLLKLERARSDAGVPFVITSGVRCERHNKSVGGVAGSSHVKGLAADIAARGDDRVKILTALAKHFPRRGIGAGFIHVDIDPAKPSPALWEYS